MRVMVKTGKTARGEDMCYPMLRWEVARLHQGELLDEARRRRLAGGGKNWGRGRGSPSRLSSVKLGRLGLRHAATAIGLAVTWLAGSHVGGGGVAGVVAKRRPIARGE